MEMTNFISEKSNQISYGVKIIFSIVADLFYLY